MSLIWRSHVTHMYESCHSYEWAMFRMRMTPSNVWHDCFTCGTWLLHMCDMTASHVWHDSFTCVTWLFHTCDMTPYIHKHKHTHTHTQTHTHKHTHTLSLSHTHTHTRTHTRLEFSWDIFSGNTASVAQLDHCDIHIHTHTHTQTHTRCWSLVQRSFQATSQVSNN